MQPSMRKIPERRGGALAVLLAVSLASGGAMVATGAVGPWQGAGEQQSAQSASVSASEPGSLSVQDSMSSQSSRASSASSASSNSSTSSANAQLGECRISSKSHDDNRAQNLSVAAKALDGKVIEPGETFSLKQALGDLSTEAGYRVAADYAEGTSEEATLAGGVCQVASALYVAAVRADLDVVERHAHPSARDYAPMGQDAHVHATGSEDLKLRNTGSAPVTIHVTAQGQTVQVQVTGTAAEPGVTHDIASQIVQNQPNGQEPAQGAETVYRVETSKVAFIDGKKRSSKVLFTDEYREGTPAPTAPGTVKPTK